ncbi:fimbrillin family protein [Bacteroides gallinaceum]|uniref:fimbrillin family protein n=1 Tax=Bacteroides gallinaceum TaxID=1462571 RepID=UPI00195F248C|nr:fimbrillin family protein [Bacteroides gallinaceum]MBM6659386.1 fimbrillin family protein [Bacteroides gallinaceum]
MRRLIDYMVWCLAGGGIFFLQACGDDMILENSASRAPIEVYMNANDDVSLYTTEEGVNAFLMFWDNAGFQKWVSADDASAPSAFTCTPTGNIDDYTYASGIAYQVQREYLPDNAYYYAAGYAPAGALTPSSDYLTLTVNEGYQNGSTDFLSCDAKEDHRGAENDRFTEEAHELQFRHLTARIRFVGVRDEVMWNRIGVNNVKVTLNENNGLCVPENFIKKVDDRHSQSTYIASEISDPQIIEMDGTSEYIPATNDGLTLGSCYVLHATLPQGYDPFEKFVESNGTIRTIQLHLDIEADLSYVMGDGDYSPYRTARWENQPVTINSKTGDVLYPGYEYVVTIRFRNESISLQGIQKAWENGGTHYLPITPKDNGQ